MTRLRLLLFALVALLISSGARRPAGADPDAGPVEWQAGALPLTGGDDRPGDGAAAPTAAFSPARLG